MSKIGKIKKIILICQKYCILHRIIYEIDHDFSFKKILPCTSRKFKLNPNQETKKTDEIKEG